MKIDTITFNTASAAGRTAWEKGVQEEGKKEPAWHRRERKNRSKAREIITVASSLLRSHHGSCLTKEIMAFNAWPDVQASAGSRRESSVSGSKLGSSRVPACGCRDGSACSICRPDIFVRLAGNESLVDPTSASSKTPPPASLPMRLDPVEPAQEGTVGPLINSLIRAADRNTAVAEQAAGCSSRSGAAPKQRAVEVPAGSDLIDLEALNAEEPPCLSKNELDALMGINGGTGSEAEAEETLGNTIPHSWISSSVQA